MSFTETVKNELARIPREDEAARRAEMLALFRMSGSLITGGAGQMGIEFSTSHNAVARRMLVYLKKDSGLIPAVMVRQGRKLRKKNVYTLAVPPSEKGLRFLQNLGFLPVTPPLQDMDIYEGTEARRAYLAGAFLGGGSVNRPQGDYHLEMVTQSFHFAELIRQCMKSFHLTPKLTDRKNDYIVYIKEGDEVTAFLQVVGAGKSLLDFENVRVMKDVRNQVNRQVNCETANLQKTVDAAVRQTYAIKTILEYRSLESLDRRMQEACRLRMEHPNASLTELSELCGISKSGLAHRYQKIIVLARILQGKRKIEE